MSKVEIISTVNHEVGITLPELRFKRSWPKRGSKISVERELLDDMLLDPGVEYMFKTGMLYIKELSVKQELGLEPEDAKEPVNIIILTDEQKKRYLTNMPIFEFKEAIKKLNLEQKKELVEYAVENEILQYDKCKILKEETGIDAIRRVDMDRIEAEE